MRAFGVAEEGDHGAHRREGGRLLDAFLLGEMSLRLAHLEDELAGFRAKVEQPIRFGERLPDARQQRDAARIERRDHDFPAASGEAERRIDEADIPARIAAGIFVIRGEDRAEMRIERRAACRDRRGAVARIAGDASHLDAAARRK